MELLIVGVLVGLVVIGWVRNRTSLHELRNQLERSVEYATALNTFVQSEGNDLAAYNQLLRSADIIQADLGPNGIAHYSPAGSTTYIPNFPVVINLVPALLKSLREDEMFSTLKPGRDTALTIYSTILRHIGTLEHSINEATRSGRNPLILLREGVQTILALPIFVLSSLGLLPTSAPGRFAGSVVVKIVAGLLSLMAVVSAVVGLIADWSDFLEVVLGWWNR